MARKRMFFDGSKAVRELGMPQTPIDRALAEAVDWFRSHGMAPEAGDRITAMSAILWLLLSRARTSESRARRSEVPGPRSRV